MMTSTPSILESNMFFFHSSSEICTVIEIMDFVLYSLQNDSRYIDLNFLENFLVLKITATRLFIGVIKIYLNRSKYTELSVESGIILKDILVENFSIFQRVIKTCLLNLQRA